MSEGEKKAKKKAKKAASKVQEDPKKRMFPAIGTCSKLAYRVFVPAAAGSNDDKGLDVGPPKDDDPDGTKLLKADDGLERAAKFLNPLAALAADSIDVWIAVYDVAVRRSAYADECFVERGSNLMLQRNICRPCKHSTVPMHWRRATLSFISA